MDAPPHPGPFTEPRGTGRAPTLILTPSESQLGDFPGGPVVKNPPGNAGVVGSIPGLG